MPHPSNPQAAAANPEQVVPSKEQNDGMARVPLCELRPCLFVPGSWADMVIGVLAYERCCCDGRRVDEPRMPKLPAP